MNPVQTVTTLILESLSAGYARSARNQTIVVHQASTVLSAGELVCILGPNGAGKTTLMRTVAGMQPPLAGRVLLNGDNIHQMRPRELARRVSVVLTDRVSVGMLTAYALVALGRHPHTDWTGKLTEEDHAAIRDAIKAVGAEDLAARQISELSDGERQKIMVARALAQETEVMVLDEITAFLDLPRRVDIMRILRDLAHKARKAILLSTHDLDLALRCADTIWLLPRNGRLQYGSPEHMVLNGAFENAFESEGVDFDRSTGTFRMHRTFARSVVLNGDGIDAFWTARALEREGIRVLSGDNDSLEDAELLRIYVLSDNGNPTWRLVDSSPPQEYGSLDEVVRHIRERR
jgi:iron complex transport system ATP-binding protein